MKVYLVHQHSSNNGAYEDAWYVDHVVGVFSTENSANNYIMGLSKPIFVGGIAYTEDELPNFPEEARGVKFYNNYDSKQLMIESDYIPEEFDPHHRYARMLLLGHSGELDFCNFEYSIVPMEVQE